MNRLEHLGYQLHLGTRNYREHIAVAYHYYIRKDGTVYRGRPEAMVGGHTLGENWHTIGICFEGNFETQTMPEAQLRSGQALLADIRARYHGIAVKRHKDYNATACPGKNFPFVEMTKEDDEMKIYSKLSDVPEAYRPTIKKLMKLGALTGKSDPAPSSLEDNLLDLDESFCRVMTTLDRMGKI